MDIARFSPQPFFPAAADGRLLDQRAAKKMELLREQHNTGVKNLIRRLFSANNSGSCCVRTQSFWAQQFGYVWGAPSGRFDQPDPWKQDFHVLPRGAGRSTCFGLGPRHRLLTSRGSFNNSLHVLHHDSSWARWDIPNSWTFWSIVSHDKVLRD